MESVRVLVSDRLFVGETTSSVLHFSVDRSQNGLGIKKKIDIIFIY
jgi:hypothetical protein